MACIGSLAELRQAGYITGKLERTPVVVFWHDDRPWAIEDRCPHLGFPLHRGTVEAGMVTCHWHHARFDLTSGCTFDPWADDAAGFDVTIDGDEVHVAARSGQSPIDRGKRRLRSGLEDNLTLVIAKSVLELLDGGVAATEILSVGAEFGAHYRAEGWGSGMTVLTALGNVFDPLDPGDRALALTQALRFLANDISGHPPRFALDPMDATEATPERLAGWYRRFIDGRSADAAERALATALGGAVRRDAVEAMMFAAATDHVFLDEGHTLDFTNKAFELVDLLGGAQEVAQLVLPTLVTQTARASRHEELSEWRHPHDLAGIISSTTLPTGDGDPALDVGGLAAALLAEHPDEVVHALQTAGKAGASAAQLALAVAHAALLRIVRFHTQNDHGDWDVVHHGFTTAHALHQATVRQPTPELQRGILHLALKVFLDRFLNVPAARPPSAREGTIEALLDCFEQQGRVDDAGQQAYGYLAAGGDPAVLVAALGRALLVEDAGFHWYQLFEASVRHHDAWTAGSEPARLSLVAFARFLAAHTPTRRERSRVVEIARRLRRDEELYDADDA